MTTLTCSYCDRAMQLLLDLSRYRNVIVSEANKSQYRDTAYVERANARWEAWTYSEGRRYRLALPTGCTKTGAINFLNSKKYDVVLVK